MEALLQNTKSYVVYDFAFAAAWVIAKAKALEQNLHCV